MRPLSRASRRTEVGTAVFATLHQVSDTRLSVLRRLAQTASGVAQGAIFWAQCGAKWLWYHGTQARDSEGSAPELGSNGHIAVVGAHIGLSRPDELMASGGSTRGKGRD